MVFPADLLSLLHLVHLRKVNLRSVNITKPSDTKTLFHKIVFSHLTKQNVYTAFRLVKKPTFFNFYFGLFKLIL